MEATPILTNDAGGPIYDSLFWMVVHTQVLAEGLHPAADARWQDLSVLRYIQDKEAEYLNAQFVVYCFGPAAATPEFDCYTALPGQATAAESAGEETTFVAQYAVPGGPPAGTSHLAVTTRGYAQWGSPASYDKASVSDLGGWALDLASLWEDYARATPSPRPNGSSTSRSFFDAKLGTRSVTDPGSFSFDDLIGDIDGFLMGTRLASNPGLRLQDAVRAVRVSIASDMKWRFAGFFQERFNSSKANAKSAVLDMFISGNLSVSGPVAYTIGGITLSTGSMGNGLVAPTDDEKGALAEAWADRLADLAAYGPSSAPT